MTQATAGVFTIDYTLRTSADPGADIQFGMDFTITQRESSGPQPLCQLIFPATAVGNNTVGKWNVDNHKPASTDPSCLVFAGADYGEITDKPTELSKRNKGILTTKFAVFRVDLYNTILEGTGVTFGYTIDTSDANPVTIFTGFKTFNLTNEQRNVVKAQCSSIRF